MDILDDDDKIPKDTQENMHSIQEEDEELEQYSKHMRTGSSIEDDEDSEEEFNKRQVTGYEETDRADIEDLQVAGTKTQLKYQEDTQVQIPDINIPDNTVNREIQDNTLNRDIQDVVAGLQDLDIDVGMPQNQRVADETIPISTNTDKTDFSIHGKSVTQFNAVEDAEEEKENVTQFSVHNEPQDVPQDEAVEQPPQEISEDQIDVHPSSPKQNSPEGNEHLHTEEQEDLEGTFQEYEFGENDLLSRTKIYGKSGVSPHKEEGEGGAKKLDFDSKPELTGTERDNDGRENTQLGSQEIIHENTPSEDPLQKYSVLKKHTPSPEQE